MPPPQVFPSGVPLTAALLLEDEDTNDLDEAFAAETLPESLGISDGEGKYVRLLRAGAPLAAKRTRKFVYPAGQADVQVTLYAGEAAVAAENRALARVRLTGLAPAGGEVEVALSVSAQGEATLSVQDKATKAAVRAVVPVA